MCILYVYLVILLYSSHFWPWFLSPWISIKLCVIFAKKADLAYLSSQAFTWLAWQTALSFTIVSCPAFSYPEAKRCGNFLYFINFYRVGGRELSIPIKVHKAGSWGEGCWCPTSCPKVRTLSVFLNIPTTASSSSKGSNSWSYIINKLIIH